MQCSEPPSKQISCDIDSTINHSEQSTVVFVTLHLLCTPSTKTWCTSQQFLSLYLNLFLKLPFKYSTYTLII